MIGVSVSASRASVRRAQQSLRRFTRDMERTEVRALKLAGSNVRKAYISGIRRGNTKALPTKVAPIHKGWHNILHPGKPQGGGLTQPHLWPIRRTGAHAVEVDILLPYRKTLEHYQHPTERWRILAATVEWMRRRGDEAKHLGYWPINRISGQYRRSARPLVYKIDAHLGGLPASADLVKNKAGTPRTPERPVVEFVRRWAAANVRGWYLSILAKLRRGRRAA